MKKISVLIVLIAIGSALFFVFQSRRAAPEKPAAGTATISEQNPPAPAAPQNPAGIPPASAAGTAASVSPASIPAAPAVALNPATMEVSSLPPPTVLDNARVVIKNYHAAFGENPVGTNPEITAALMGKNPRQINFVTEESGLRVNVNGEMVDAWGTPFFFHQISGQEMEIRSAGEDRKMWTADDLVTR